ncbi:MAG: hypothetical protein PHY43_01415 [Verrucomicrobiales bacterium]|nr:hypothetical protein [Verrucomicrobiales bacterium]
MPTLVLLWVWVCAYLNCAGWTLSALHQLNAGGYAVALAVGFSALLVWRKTSSPQMLPQVHWHKYLHRFRRPFPLAFLILAAMASLGGVIYAPTNYDALAYRLPRILHWLAADQWHWIHTFFPRLNNRSCGIEWVSAPFLALLKTDRLLFLINTVSFLLLPGLVFSVFTRLGVRRRVAWHWMWIAPTGYCFVLQAGSIGNDLFGATFALAAVDFALRAKKSGLARDLFAAILAAAMMTSAKTGSLPLLLPCALALLPSLKLFFRWPVRTVAVCVIGLFASALPTMVLNAKFSGDWSGAGIGRDAGKNATVLRVGANTVSLASQNLVPPVFPLADKWNQEVLKRIPSGLESRLRSVMLEHQAYEFSVSEMQIEENAGLGFGVSALLLVSVVAAGLTRQKKIFTRNSAWQRCVRWAPVISLLAMMTQYNLSVFCRIITPYYALLLPVFLNGAAQERLVKKGWWRVAAGMVFLMAAGLLVISPARPLFPVQTILGKVAGHAAHSKALARMEEVYTVYRERNDGFAPARAILPPGLKVLGMITYDDPEASLWRPWGSRRIEHVCATDTAADLRARGIQYILLREQVMSSLDCTLNDWLKRMDAQVIVKIPLNLRASSGPLGWDLVKLN